MKILFLDLDPLVGKPRVSGMSGRRCKLLLVRSCCKHQWTRTQLKVSLQLSLKSPLMCLVWTHLPSLLTLRIVWIVVLRCQLKIWIVNHLKNLGRLVLLWKSPMQLLKWQNLPDIPLHQWDLHLLLLLCHLFLHQILRSQKLLLLLPPLQNLMLQLLPLQNLVRLLFDSVHAYGSRLRRMVTLSTQCWRPRIRSLSSKQLEDWKNMSGFWQWTLRLNPYYRISCST